jgi:phospholipid transport system transporter-binding protein
MFQLPPSLTFDNANAVLEEGMRAIAAGQAEFDFSPLTTLDSAAVAILLAWRRAAAVRGSALQFQNLPGNLQSLGQLYGVADLLSITAKTDAPPDKSGSLPHH